MAKVGPNPYLSKLMLISKCPYLPEGRVQTRVDGVIVEHLNGDVFRRIVGVSQTEVVTVSRCHGNDGRTSVARTVELRNDLDVSSTRMREDLVIIGLRVEPAPRP